LSLNSWASSMTSCQPVGCHLCHRRLSLGRAAPVSDALLTLGRDRHREWQRRITGRVRRPPAIRLHRGDPAGHHLRRSGDHRLGDTWPLGPSTSSMDGLAPRGRQQGIAFMTGCMVARRLLACRGTARQRPTLSGTPARRDMYEPAARGILRRRLIPRKAG